MNKQIDSNMHELVKHGTSDMPVAFYYDSYHYLLNHFFYMHYHEELEYIYSLNGEMNFLINGKQYHIKENEGILINSNILHQICHSDFPESNLIFIVFSTKLLEFAPYLKIKRQYLDELFSLDYNAIIFHNDILWQNKFNKKMIDTFEIANMHNKGYEFLITINFLDAFYNFYLHYQEINYITNINKNDQRIKKALSYIKNHYNESISLKDIANSICLSNEECSRIFKKYTNISPINFLINYRIKMSCNYLLSTNMTITEIALNCGFTSSNYYTIAFKKLLNITPKKYRNSNKKL